MSYFADATYLSAGAAILSALTALIALIIGPLLSIYITKKQTSTNLVLSEHKEWSDNLRQNISAFIAIMTAVTAYPGYKILSKQDEVASKVEELILLKSKVGLLINQDERSHSDFYQHLDDTLLIFMQLLSDPANAEKRRDVMSALKVISYQTYILIKARWKILEQ